MNLTKKIKKTFAVIGILFTVNAVAENSRADWISKYDELKSSYLISYPTVSSRSGSIAWAEGYMLDSLLEMYIATNDSKYLSTFTTRVNSAINIAKDDIGAGSDGYKGWGDWAYSVNSVENYQASNVDNSDSTLPSSWKRWQSSSNTAYRDTSNFYGAPAGFTVATAPNSQSWQVLQTPMKNIFKSNGSYDANTKYHVYFHGKNSWVC